MFTEFAGFKEKTFMNLLRKALFYRYIPWRPSR